MGVWAARSVFAGVGGGLSFCIDDLPVHRRTEQRVDRRIRWDYRGLTSGGGSMHETQFLGRIEQQFFSLPR
jgi:hypothetical protein